LIKAAVITADSLLEELAKKDPELQSALNEMSESLSQKEVPE
jgi:hypothetical protein